MKAYEVSGKLEANLVRLHSSIDYLSRVATALRDRQIEKDIQTIEQTLKNSDVEKLIVAFHTDTLGGITKEEVVGRLSGNETFVRQSMESIEEIENRAMEKMKRTRERMNRNYGIFTWISTVLYAAGWGLSLLAKLYGFPEVESGD